MNFPVSFLNGAFKDIRGVISNIMDYAAYKHSQNLSVGTDLERMKSAASFFSISFNNIEQSMKNAKALMRTEDIKAPNVSINMDILWNYYNKPKNEFEIACFCAFCAIKSIIGNKEYAKTNKSLIIERMFGLSAYPKDESIPDVFSVSSAVDFIHKQGFHIGTNRITDGIKLGELIAVKQASSYAIQKNDLIKWATTYIGLPKYTNLKSKYSTRYHIDRVLLNLQTKWNLKLYSDHSRGFFLSFSKSLEELAVLNIESKTKSQSKLLTKEKAEAKETALKKLGLK